jgi:hypothetical protein
MEACLAVEREQEKVVKKLKAVSGSATEKLQQVLHQIQALKELLTAAAPDAKHQGGRAGCLQRTQRHARHYIQTGQGH